MDKNDRKQFIEDTVLSDDETSWLRFEWAIDYSEGQQYAFLVDMLKPGATSSWLPYDPNFAGQIEYKESEKNYFQTGGEKSTRGFKRESITFRASDHCATPAAAHQWFIIRGTMTTNAVFTFSDDGEEIEDIELDGHAKVEVAVSLRLPSNSAAVPTTASGKKKQKTSFDWLALPVFEEMPKKANILRRFLDSLNRNSQTQNGARFALPEASRQFLSSSTRAMIDVISRSDNHCTRMPNGKLYSAYTMIEQLKEPKCVRLLPFALALHVLDFTGKYAVFQLSVAPPKQYSINQYMDEKLYRDGIKKFGQFAGRFKKDASRTVYLLYRNIILAGKTSDRFEVENKDALVWFKWAMRQAKTLTVRSELPLQVLLYFNSYTRAPQLQNVSIGDTKDDVLVSLVNQNKFLASKITRVTRDALQAGAPEDQVADLPIDIPSLRQYSYMCADRDFPMAPLEHLQRASNLTHLTLANVGTVHGQGEDYMDLTPLVPILENVKFLCLGDFGAIQDFTCLPSLKRLRILHFESNRSDTLLHLADSGHPIDCLEIVERTQQDGCDIEFNGSLRFDLMCHSQVVPNVDLYRVLSRVRARKLVLTPIFIGNEHISTLFEQTPQDLEELVIRGTNVTEECLLPILVAASQPGSKLRRLKIHLGYGSEYTNVAKVAFEESNRIRFEVLERGLLDEFELTWAEKEEEEHVPHLAVPVPVRIVHGGEV